jgi:hypothetical protein
VRHRRTCRVVGDVADEQTMELIAKRGIDEFGKLLTGAVRSMRNAG